MASISNSAVSSVLSMTDGQVAIGSGGGPVATTMGGDATITKTGVITVLSSAGDFKNVGKVGFHNATPVAQSTDSGLANASVSIALLTEVAGVINAQAAILNAQRKCLRDHGLMA
jgi:hypothetical protein